VTAFGESAGAFLLTYLMLCQQKLFRRVIIQSGAAQTSGFMSLEKHEKVYERLLQRASIRADSGAERLKALRELPTEELVRHLSVSVHEVGMAVENASSSQAIWSHPCVLSRLKAGHWSPHIESVMVGVCKDEGALLSYWAQSHTSAGYQYLQQEFLAGVTHETLGPLYDLPHQAEIDNPPVGFPLDFTRCSGSLAVADKLFNVPVELLLAALDGAMNAQTHKPLSIYFYKLDGSAVESMPPGRFLGAPQTIDIVLLFNMSHCWAADSESAKVSATIGKMWYDYARAGQPGANWPEYQRQHSPYRLVIHQDGGVSLQDLRERDQLERDRMLFWADFLQLSQFCLLPGTLPVIGILDGCSSTGSFQHPNEQPDEKVQSISLP